MEYRLSYVVFWQFIKPCTAISLVIKFCVLYRYIETLLLLSVGRFFSVIDCDTWGWKVSFPRVIEFTLDDMLTHHLHIFSNVSCSFDRNKKASILLMVIFVIFIQIFEYATRQSYRCNLYILIVFSICSDIHQGV